LFEGVAGFQPDPEVPGFRRIAFEPTILPRIGYARAYHDSPAGRIEAEWRLGEGAKVEYRIRVPEGSEGVLILGPEHRDVRVDGTAVATTAGQSVRHNVGAGEHHIAFRLHALA
jgi:alpha-L-rhamnosidase